jgi:hypothetical protein
MHKLEDLVPDEAMTSVQECDTIFMQKLSFKDMAARFTDQIMQHSKVASSSSKSTLYSIGTLITSSKVKLVYKEVNAKFKSTSRKMLQYTQTGNSF